jgi:hypothetical protein
MRRTLTLVRMTTITNRIRARQHVYDGRRKRGTQAKPFFRASGPENRAVRTKAERNENV